MTPNEEYKIDRELILDVISPTKTEEEELQDYFRGTEAPVCKIIKKCLEDKREIYILEQSGDISLAYPVMRERRMYAIAEESKEWQKDWVKRMKDEDKYNIIWTLNKKDLYEVVKFMELINFSVNLSKTDLNHLNDNDKILGRFDVLDLEGKDI